MLLQDRLQNLARPRTELYKKLAELKALMESEKLQECSFKVWLQSYVCDFCENIGEEFISQRIC